MKINRVLDYYYRAYRKAARNEEVGRGAINVAKGLVGASANPARYEKLKRLILRIISGSFYWPSTFPTGVDQPTVEFLYSLVRLTRPEFVVEIGTAKGNSGIAIGQALEDNQRGILHTIDPMDQIIVRIAIKKSGLSHRIKYHIDYSGNRIPLLKLPRIDFAFIDGDHAYDHVKADWDLVSPLLVSGSLVAFHDTVLFEGPRRVLNDLLKSGEYSYMTMETINKAGISVIKKL